MVPSKLFPEIKPLPFENSKSEQDIMMADEGATTVSQEHDSPHDSNHD